MDADKTGAFIARLRKDKAYTQKDLARKLHISDKAISRWETGKGFPDTALLKPLGDELGVSVGELLAGERLCEPKETEQAAATVLEPSRRSNRKMPLPAVLGVAFAVLALVIGGIVAAVSVNQTLSAVEFVNGSQTKLLYSLADDNMHIQITYPDYEKREFDGGYEYYLPDGTERYVFTQIPGYSEHPVMSYMHCSGEGTLFGISLGEPTVVDKNPALGVARDYSLIKHLEENGFEWQYPATDFGRPNVVYINGERCNWLVYTKEDVFLNLCISAYEGRRLLAYDIGILDDSLDAVFAELSRGFPVTLEDPYGLVTNTLEDRYPQWDTVTITADDTRFEAVYLYINGELADKFTTVSDLTGTSYRVSFAMWGAPMEVLVTPEMPK